MAAFTKFDIPICPTCKDQNWVRLGSRPTEVRRIALDVKGRPFTFLDRAPSAETRGMTSQWECAVCMRRLHPADSLEMDALRRRMARAA